VQQASQKDRAVVFATMGSCSGLSRYLFLFISYLNVCAAHRLATGIDFHINSIFPVTGRNNNSTGDIESGVPGSAASPAGRTL
jgi:hypothetical protein